MGTLPLVAAAVLAVQVQDGAPAGQATWERQEPEFRRIARALASGPNPYLGTAQRAQLERRLADDAGAPLGVRIGVRRRLARQLLKHGELERSVELLEEALELARAANAGMQTRQILSALGLAFLRQAETQNCVLRHNAECCIFPLKGGALHEQRTPAERARECYEEVLRLEPDDLEARWLLNLVAMALGEYPDGLEERWRIPEEAFASHGEVGRFRDIAPALGLDAFDLCGGVVVEDFDGDGFLDVLSSTYDPAGPLHYFQNGGDGTFEDRSDASHASDQLGGLNLVAGDFDGDGDPDVLVLRGAWLMDDGRIRNSLLRNDDGVFVDVTRAVGLAEPAMPTQTAAFGDFDGDGDLDVYVGNESRAEVDERGDYPGQLFLNESKGGAAAFVDVAERAGVTNDRFCKGVTAGDFDNDGDLDLYLSNFGPNRLYRNQGDVTFVDVGVEAGVVEPVGRSFACWFFDQDNDGWLDLFVGAYDAIVADLAAEALGREYNASPPRLYRNGRDGTFTDVAPRLGIARPFKPMGANFGDIDGDGWLDVYLTTGEPQLSSLMPNVMLRNDRGERFVDVTTAGGFGHLQKGHGVAFADLDHDGDQDVYNQLGGFFPVDRFHNALFQNPGHGNRWLYLDLVGTRTNRRAVGARIRVVVATPDGTREIHRAVGAVSSFGGSPLRQEIGLGDATRVVRLEVRWPNGGAVQRFDDVPLDALLRVTEDEPSFERVELRRLRF